MTVAELAEILNTSVSGVFAHYKLIREEIPNDPNYVLSEEQIRRVIPNYKSENSPQSENVAQLEEPKTASVLEEPVNPTIPLKKILKQESAYIDSFYNENEKNLLLEFKIHNRINDLIFEGEYRKVPDRDFGFFINLIHHEGNGLTYPVTYDLVDDIFVGSTELLEGKRYTFESVLARKSERIKKKNPFLLQVKNSNISEIKEISQLNQILKIKQEKLQEINTYLETAEEVYVNKKDEVEEKVAKAFIEKENEANKTIEEYHKKIKERFNEIQVKENELAYLTEAVGQTNNNLANMEKLLSTLKERISLCRNLQFISKDYENKYLNLLTSNEFKPSDHLYFEADFKNSFSKLSDHIHAYLFHKKNLIYTSFQIRNFLALLQTHDIIVLSGLSGSGKTQIVKAFAEALGGIAKIIPVKPNWTSSDDLIGYYNPIQMSFLPTPFTEAIVEAIHNPNQLFFICLDEMNLARAEYYFADFLSKLEERSIQPEIELYANHEEELFVSEFNTLLNIIESSIKGKQIKSWQEFLDNEEARKKFFEMLGNTDKESMLQLHSKMKRRLIDILKFPSTIQIPNNVRFIGAINVDETTHYFSPKILDRVHIVKFDNPLFFEEQVNGLFANDIEKELKPVYVNSQLFSNRTDYPKINEEGSIEIVNKLKEINKLFLLPLNIDFGIRSIRQSINFYNLFPRTYHSIMDDLEDNYTPEESEYFAEQKYFEKISLNTIIIQKILPRFIFDGSEIAKNGKSKMEIVEEFQKFLVNELKESSYKDDSNEVEIGKASYEYLVEMIEQAKRNNSQFNFFAQ